MLVLCVKMTTMHHSCFLFSQKDLNDLVKDLALSKEKTELLAS